MRYINGMLLYLGQIAEIAGWMMLNLSHRVYHLSGHHMHCSRLNNLADAADQIDDIHYALQVQHERARSARSN